MFANEHRLCKHCLFIRVVVSAAFRCPNCWSCWSSSVLIALPNLMPLISRAKATEAQQQLTYLHTLQRSNFYTYSRYSSSLDELGFEQSRLVTDGGQANYLVEIVEASEHGFRATATAVVDFDGDGVYNVWEIDQDKNLRETVKD